MVERVEIGKATLYCGNALDIIPALASRAQVVITDPPYGIEHPCNFGQLGRSRLAECYDYSDVVGDDRAFDPQAVLALGLPTVLFGANHFADKLPVSSGWLVWDKLRPDELDQSTCELAWSNCVKGVRRFAHHWHGMMRASERGENYHPTQKPVALFQWILSLRWIARIAGTVLDPYMGAGPCGVAAVKAGRSFIGIEIQRDYFDLACRRIEDAERQGALFEQPKTSLQSRLFD